MRRKDKKSAKITGRACASVHGFKHCGPSNIGTITSIGCEFVDA